MSIIKVEKHNYTVEPLTQWDRNQVLEIHGLSLARVPEVHFVNNAMDRAIIRQATMDSAGVITVSVPNGLLQKPYTITAHLCAYTGATFETLYTVKIPVTPRKQPSDYTIEDDGDIYSFNELSNKVEQAVEDMSNLRQAVINDLGPLVGEKIGEFVDASLSQTGRAADAKAVSESLNALTAALSGTTVWTNTDPDVTFDSQKITLDLSPYKSVRVIFKIKETSDSYYLREVVCTMRGAYRAHQSSDKVYRNFIVSDDGIEITTGSTTFTPISIIGYTY